jgi:hypothetical protein
MSHLWGEPEEIAVSVDAAGRPSAFVWHGRKHPIEKWGDAYLIETEWWSEQGEVRRQMWPVVTRTGLKCDLCFDLLSETRWMSSVYD